jgi:hypothetical protein
MATAKLQERRQAAADAAREQAKFDARLDQSKLPDYLHKTGEGGKAAGDGLKDAAKAAREAEQGFSRLESAAEAALEKINPAEALRRRGADMQKLLDQYGAKLDPVLRDALQQEIKLNLDGKELERVKKQVNELADDVSQTLGNAFENAFTRAGAGFDDLFQDIGKSFSSMGFQAFQTNFLKPMMSGLMGGAANDNTFLKDLRSGIEAGTENGTGAAWESIVSSSSATYNKNGGAVGAGVAGTAGVVGAYQGGYQSQSPMMGALGGALAGAGLGASIGGPIGAAAGAVIGGIVGLVGGIVGASDAAEKRMHEANKRLEAQEEAIEAMRASWTGEGVGTIQAWRAENEKARKEAQQLARQAGDEGLARQLGDDYRAGQKRQVEAFRASFDLMIDSLRNGSGPSGPLVAARQAVLDLVEGFKSFVADTKDVGRSVSEATSAAQASLLGMINPREFTGVEEALDTLRGTSRGVREALVELGMSATKAGEAVKKELNAALDELKGDFLDGLRERINDATGKGYLNDINEAIRQRDEDMKSAKALGLSNTLVQQAFQATVQDIVTGADLTEKQFAKLRDQFPFLSQAIEDATDSIADSIRSAQMAISDFRISLLTSPQNPMGPDAALAAATAQYQTTLAAARDTTDPTRQLAAMEDLPAAAQTYLEAAQEMWATSEQYGAIFSQVLADLGTVDGPRSDADRIVAKLEESRQAVVGTKSVLDLIKISNDNLPGVLTALGVSNAKLTTIDTNGDGAITKMEAVRALAAAQDLKLGISNTKLTTIDTNGDGAISKLEAVRALNAAQDLKLDAANDKLGTVKTAVDTNATTVKGQLTATLGTTGTNTKQAAATAKNTATANAYTDKIASQYYASAITGLKESLKQLYDIAWNTYALDYDSQRPRTPNYSRELANFIWAADGGWISGPGTSRSDSIPARLSNGEFVVNAASARANAGLLNAINDNKALNLDPVVTSIHQAATAQIAELRKMRAVLERLEGSAGVAARTSAREAASRPSVGWRKANDRPGR